MQSNNLITVIIGAALGVVLLATLCIPLISTATETTETVTNDGYFHMEKYDTTEDITIVWDYTAPTEITVNDSVYTLETPTNQWISLAIGDSFCFRYANGAPNYFANVVIDLNNGTVSGNTTDSKSVTLTCSNGTVTATNGTVTKSTTYTELYVISGDSGEYVMKKSTESVYMNADTEFLAMGLTSVEGGSCHIKITGSIEDGATVDIISTTATTPTVSNISVNYTENNDPLAYNLSTITFTITADEVDTAATYSYFVVPAEITAEKAVHFDSSEIAMLELIPLLLAVALVLGVVAYAVRARLS